MNNLNKWCQTEKGNDSYKFNNSNSNNVSVKISVYTLIPNLNNQSLFELCVEIFWMRRNIIIPSDWTYMIAIVRWCKEILIRYFYWKGVYDFLWFTISNRASYRTLILIFSTTFVRLNYQTWMWNILLC